MAKVYGLDLLVLVKGELGVSRKGQPLSDIYSILPASSLGFS